MGPLLLVMYVLCVCGVPFEARTGVHVQWRERGKENISLMDTSRALVYLERDRPRLNTHHNSIIDSVRSLLTTSNEP